MTLELDADGLAHVPTAEELSRRGLARIPAGSPAWRIDPAGYELINAAMSHNADLLRANPALARKVTAAAFERPARK